MRAKRSGQAAKNTQTAVGYHGTLRAGLALCLLAALPVQAARNTQKTGSAFRWIPRRGAFRTDTAGGRIPLPANGRSIRGLDLACAEGTAVLAVQGGSPWCGGIQPKLRQPSAHPAPGWQRDPLRPCNTFMSARERWCRPGRRWAQQGRQAAPPVRTCILNCTVGTACDPADACAPP